MKHWAVYLKFLIVLGLLASAIIAYSGNRADLKSPDRRYLKSLKGLQHEPSELFRRIIISHIKPHIGNGAENSPAIAVGLVTGQGDVVVGLGSREIDKKLPPDGDTLFGIGSITKLLTGLILAQAIDNGDMSLSTKANKWLDKKVQIDDRITLTHLVTHSSGLPNFPENIAKRDNFSEDPETSKFMPAKNYSKTDLGNCLKNKNCRPQKPPGEHYLYSNLGIGLLSIALQNRYGFSDFNRLNQAKITQVLYMENTSTDIPSFLEKHKDNIAQGYQYLADSHSLKPVPFTDMGILAGSGGLISSVNDMNKFLRMITGLSHGSLERAAKQFQIELGDSDKPGLKIGYAHKIQRSSDGGNIHSKAGNTAGYSAIVLWRDNPKVGLIILANRGKFRQVSSISNKLLEAITHQIKLMQ